MIHIAGNEWMKESIWWLHEKRIIQLRKEIKSEKKELQNYN